MLLGFTSAFKVMKSWNGHAIRKTHQVLYSDRSKMMIGTTNVLEEKVDNIQDEPIVFEDDAPKVTWNASVKSSVKVKESGDRRRSVEAYMALPASEYSILSAKQIERLSDTEFKCTLVTMNFFGTKITPVLYVDVNVYPDQAKSVISVTKAETIGSRTADMVNGTFTISAENVVTGGMNEKGRKVLTSDTFLEVNVKVPKSKIPLRIIRSGGNFIMQSSLNVIVPTFTRILAADFRRWTEGSDKRDEVEGAKLG